MVGGECHVPFRVGAGDLLHGPVLRHVIYDQIVRVLPFCQYVRDGHGDDAAERLVGTEGDAVRHVVADDVPDRLGHVVWIQDVQLQGGFGGSEASEGIVVEDDDPVADGDRHGDGGVGLRLTYDVRYGVGGEYRIVLVHVHCEVGTVLRDGGRPEEHGGECDIVVAEDHAVGVAVPSGEGVDVTDVRILGRNNIRKNHCGTVCERVSGKLLPIRYEDHIVLIDGRCGIEHHIGCPEDELTVGDFGIVGGPIRHRVSRLLEHITDGHLGAVVEGVREHRLAVDLVDDVVLVPCPQRIEDRIVRHMEAVEVDRLPVGGIRPSCEVHVVRGGEPVIRTKERVFHVRDNRVH